MRSYPCPGIAPPLAPPCNASSSSPPGLPNPNFRNQGFFVKNQELIRRFSPKKSEGKSGDFSRSQKENRSVA
jgi:hypothetical protein